MAGARIRRDRADMRVLPSPGGPRAPPGLCGRGLPAPHAKPFTHDGPSHRARARFMQGAAEGVAAPVGIGKAYRYSTGSADRTTSRRSMKPPTSTPASPMTLTTIEVIEVSTRFVMNTG